MRRRGVRRHVLLAILAVGPLGPLVTGVASAQTILNTERFQLGEVDGIHASVDLAASLQRGNTRLFDVSGSGMVGTLAGRHWPRVIFGGKYLSNDQRSILDQQFVQLRYSYVVGPRTQTFHFVQAQKNETLLLRSRWLVGSGLRRELIDAESTMLAIGTGAMVEWEELDPGRIDVADEASARATRMANMGVFSHDFEGGARILNILYVQPDLSDFGDLRLLNDLALLVPLTAQLRSTVSLEWRRNSRPPSTLSQDDVALRAGFSIQLN